MCWIRGKGLGNRSKPRGIRREVFEDEHCKMVRKRQTKEDD